MKVSLTNLFILFSIVYVANAEKMHAQILERKVTVGAVNLTLRSFLLEIEKQAQVKFVYQSELIPAFEQVSSRFEDEPLGSVLTSVLGPRNIGFEAEGRQIILRRLSEGSSAGFGQGTNTEMVDELIINGRVTSELNEGIPGVNVLLKGTTTGTTTDIEGNYTLSVAEETGTLVFSYIGYTTEEVPINGRSKIDVSMVPDIKSLSEIVVVGYGTVKKSDLTGSVTSVKGDEIRQTPITSLDQGLQGRAAGVQITQTSAQPGGAVSIRIRGGNSILGGNEPLFVIDGFPIYNGSGNGQNNPLNTINPNDIESIEVLKDASGTAIYGSRGANGVIIINTKRGKSGVNRVDFEGYYGIQQVREKIPMMNGIEYATYINEAFTNAGRPIIFDGSSEVRPTPEQAGQGTDWLGQVLQEAPISNYQLTFSGGDKQTKYSVSGNYFNQQGIVLNSGFERGSVRINLDRKISEKFSIGNSLSLTRSVSSQLRTATFGGVGTLGVISTALHRQPTFPVYNADGTYNLTNIIPGIGGQTSNAVALARELVNEVTSNRVLGNIFGNYDILKNLSLKGTLGADYTGGFADFYASRNTLPGQSTSGNASINGFESMSFLTEVLLTYSLDRDRYSINAVAGYSSQNEVGRTVSAAATGFVNDLVGVNNLSTGSTPGIPMSNKVEWDLRSWFARLNYSLKNRYLLTVTGRADGSSKFGSDNKWGFFPSAALGWKISEEPFMSGTQFVSDLKLRASVGLTGNQEIGTYQSLQQIAPFRYSFNNALVLGLAPGNLSNPSLQWEKTLQYNAGLDLTVLNGRLDFSFDAYYKHTSNLLALKTLPLSSGFTSVLDNLGELENKGVEFSASGRVLTGNFKWDVNGNLALNRTKIVDLGEVSEYFAPPLSFAGNGSKHILREGLPVSMFYGLQTDGIYRTQEEADAGPTIAGGNAPGEWRFVDTNQDGVINDKDLTVIGNPHPKLIYGINNSFSFKGLELGIFIQGVYGNDVINGARAATENGNGSFNQTKRMLDRWSPSNPDAQFPKALAGRGRSNFSSELLENGTYLRVKNITLAYHLPQDLLEGRFLKSAKIYVSAINPFTFTEYTGFDPEVNALGQNNMLLGVDYGSYPMAKSFLVGLNIGL